MTTRLRRELDHAHCTLVAQPAQCGQDVAVPRPGGLGQLDRCAALQMLVQRAEDGGL